MKRILSILACFLVLGLMLLPSLAVPASAAESDNPQFDSWINAFDFAQFDSPSGNSYYGDSPLDPMRIPIVTTERIYSIDVLFSTDYPVSDLSVYYPNSSYSLTLYTIEEGRLYRAYGQLPGIFYSEIEDDISYLGFNLSSSGSGSYFTFLQLNYSCVNHLRYTLPGTGYFSWAGGAEYTWLFNGSSTANFLPPVPTDVNKTGFTMYVDSSLWRQYDYIDYIIYLQGVNVSSIGAVFREQSIPFTVNSVVAGADTINPATYVSIQLDLRGLNRDYYNVPYIIISGSGWVNQVASVSVLKASGLVVTNNVNPLFIYFNSVRDSITSNADRIISAFTAGLSGNGQGAAIKEQVAGKTESFDNILGGLNSGVAADRPDSSDISSSLDISGVLSPTAITTSTGFLTAVFDVPTLSKLLSLTLIFALAATILFGKR